MKPNNEGKYELTKRDIKYLLAQTIDTFHVLFPFNPQGAGERKFLEELEKYDPIEEYINGKMAEIQGKG